jgi:predicted DNA-binding transcriptional regulator AlpA
MYEASSPVPHLLLRSRDAARALGLSERTLWAYTEPRGSIPRVKVGGRVLYDPEDLRTWIARQKGGDDDQAE